MGRELIAPAPDLGSSPLDPTRARVGRVNTPLVSRRAVILIGVAAIGMIWRFHLEPAPEPARMRKVLGDPQSQTIAFAVSTDRTTIATAHSDGGVALRSRAEGWNLHRLLNDRGLIWALAFAPDGRSLALGGAEPDITVCDLGSERPERVLKIPTGETRALAFSPDGRTLAAASNPTGTIILWDLTANRERTRLHSPASSVISLAFSPDGQNLAAGTYGGRAVIVWDLATGSEHSRLLPTWGSWTMTSLAYSPDGSLLAATSRFEGLVRIWDRAGRLVRLLNAHSHSLNSVAFAPDGRRLATADNNGTVKLWSVETEDLLASMDSHADWLWGVSFSSDGRTLIGVASDDDLRLWDLTELSKDRTDHPVD
jgi:WD40 repeat protein